jgi:hypothetical protein
MADAGIDLYILQRVAGYQAGSHGSLPVSRRAGHPGRWNVIEGGKNVG